MDQWLTKIPKRVRPRLPSLSDSEVVVTNVADTIDVSTILGQVSIQEVSDSASMESVNSANYLFARFRFDIIKKSISPLVCSTKFGSCDPVKLKCGGGDHDKCDSVFPSESTGKRIRFRSKGELRPEVPCSRFRRMYPPPLPRRITASSTKAGKEKKRAGYLNLSKSQKLPRLVSPSSVPGNPSPLLASHTLSHNQHIAMLTNLSPMTTDPLISGPLTDKNSSLENRFVKAPNVGKKRSSYALSADGVVKRSCGAGKRSPAACKVLLRPVHVAGKKAPVGKGSSPAGVVSRPVQSNSGNTPKRTPNLSMSVVNKMMFESDDEEEEEEEDEDWDEAKNNKLGKKQVTSRTELDPAFSPVKKTVKKTKKISTQRKAHSRTSCPAECPSANASATPKSSRRTKVVRRKILIKDSAVSEVCCSCV